MHESVACLTAVVAPWKLRVQVCGSDPVLISSKWSSTNAALVSFCLKFWAGLGFNWSRKEGRKGLNIERFGGKFSLLQVEKRKTRASKDNVNEFFSRLSRA